MKLSLDEYNKVLKILPGLYQYSEQEDFVQSELALTEEELLFYDDSAPDEIRGDTFHYKIKKRVAFKDLGMVVNERIVKNPALKKYGRLVFLSKEGKESFIYYYFLTDKKAVKDYLKEFKNRGLKLKKREIDLSPEKI